MNAAALSQESAYAPDGVQWMPLVVGQAPSPECPGGMPDYAKKVFGAIINSSWAKTRTTATDRRLLEILARDRPRSPAYLSMGLTWLDRNGWIARERLHGTRKSNARTGEVENRLIRVLKHLRGRASRSDVHALTKTGPGPGVHALTKPASASMSMHSQPFVSACSALSFSKDCLEQENVNVGCAGGETERQIHGVKDGATVIEFPSNATARAAVAAGGPPAPDDPGRPGAGMTDAELDAAAADLKARSEAPGPKGRRAVLRLEWLALEQERQSRLSKQSESGGGSGEKAKPQATVPTRAGAVVATRASSDRPPDFNAVLRRLRPDSGYTGDAPEEAAQEIATRLKDRHSLAGWRRVCGRVKQGDVPLKILQRALKMARSGTAENPGAVAMSVIIKWQRENMKITV